MIRDLKYCAWLAPIGMAILFLGMMPAAHFIPPPSPALGAQDIATFYAAHSIGIRLASMSFVAGATCFVVFYAAISVAMMRMEPSSLLLAAIQFSSGILSILPLYFAGMLFGTAAFRPDRSAELVQLVNDMGWVLTIMPAQSLLPQLVALALAILRDRSARPVFPRWVAYVNFWVAILFQPGMLMILFKRGPFAWDGLLAFWLPFIVFALWMYVMCWALLRMPFGTADGAEQ